MSFRKGDHLIVQQEFSMAHTDTTPSCYFHTNDIVECRGTRASTVGRRNGRGREGLVLFSRLEGEAVWTVSKSTAERYFRKASR